jgi:hypothetical protein
MPAYPGDLYGWNEIYAAPVSIAMSRAFIKEGDDQWLEDIAPTQHALINFLTRENNGIRVYETGGHTAKDGTEFVTMSNGLTYSKSSGRWKVIT